MGQIQSQGRGGGSPQQLVELWVNAQNGGIRSSKTSGVSMKAGDVEQETQRLQSSSLFNPAKCSWYKYIVVQYTA